MRGARASVQPVAGVARGAAGGVVRGTIGPCVAGSVCARALLQGALAIRRRRFCDGLILRARAIRYRAAGAAAVVVERVRDRQVLAAGARVDCAAYSILRGRWRNRLARDAD